MCSSEVDSSRIDVGGLGKGLVVVDGVPCGGTRMLPVPRSWKDKGNPPSAHFGADLPVDFGSQHAIGLRHKKNEIDVCRE